MSAGDQVGGSQPLDEPEERELLREEIDRVREDLGETVEALANKADLKGQIHDKVQDTKAQVHGKVEEAKAHVGMGVTSQRSDLRRKLDGPTVPAALAAFCAVLLVRSILRRR